MGRSGVVLWDFDGTLAQRPGRWSRCLAETISTLDPSMELHADDLRPGLRDGFPWHRHEHGHLELNEPDAWWNALLPLLTGAYRRAGVDARTATRAAELVRSTYIDPVAWTVYADTRPALLRLRAQGWRHIVVSNHVPELPQLVTALGLADLFDDVLTSASIGWEKPHPAIFQHARTRAGNPDTVIMVGDNPDADIAGATRAGLAALLVRGESGIDLREAAERIMTGQLR